jgi:hypothetical protein
MQNMRTAGMEEQIILNVFKYVANCSAKWSLVGFGDGGGE